MAIYIIHVHGSEHPEQYRRREQPGTCNIQRYLSWLCIQHAGSCIQHKPVRVLLLLRVHDNPILDLLINSYGSGEKEKIALMYLLWSIVGAVVFVTGALSAYALTGSLRDKRTSKPYGITIRWIRGSMHDALGFGVKLACLGFTSGCPLPTQTRPHQ